MLWSCFHAHIVNHKPLKMLQMLAQDHDGGTWQPTPIVFLLNDFSSMLPVVTSYQ